MTKHTMEILYEELAAVRRELAAVRLERDHYIECVRWYASPEQWTPVTDDRGRETLTFCWGDDGGAKAALCLRRWNNGEVAQNLGTVGGNEGHAEVAPTGRSVGAADA